MVVWETAEEKSESLNKSDERKNRLRFPKSILPSCKKVVSASISAIFTSEMASPSPPARSIRVRVYIGHLVRITIANRVLSIPAGV